MEQLRPIVFSIGGWDPCGGAGLAADIKTFEQLGVLGMGVCSAVTVQTEDQFYKMIWTQESLIFEQLDALLNQYKPSAIKIGIVEDLSVLSKILDRCSGISVVWDPVLKASAGYDFHRNINRNELSNILKKISLVTPNIEEAKVLFDNVNAEKIQLHQIDNEWGNILIKGGHAVNHASDLLIMKNDLYQIEGEKFENPGKHGTGCVLSAAIASFLVLGSSMPKACKQAKSYVERFILSTDELLGYHSLIE